MFKREWALRGIAVSLAVIAVLATAFPAPTMADTRAKPSARTSGELSLVGIGLSEFEVDGNALNDLSVPGDDWDLLYGGGGSHQIWTGIMEDTLGVYKGGTDLDDFTTLSWDDGTPPDKADLLHAYVAVYPGNHVFFGADRYATTGTTYMGYWLLQNPVTLTGIPTGGGFDGARTVGDILILANFENGGGRVVIGVYKWLGVGNLQAMPVDSNTSFAVVSSAPTTSPWPYTPKSGPANVFPAGAFFEGGADLGALGIQGCFTHFIAETRASAVLNSVLKDFVLGALPTKPYVSINPSPASMCVGDPGVTLCANIVPGTGAPPFTYAWTGLNVVSPAESCTVAGNGLAAGSYTYKLVVTGCNGCSSDTAYCTLTVNAAPTGSIDGASTVCPGSTNDHCGPEGMGTYSWSISGSGTIVGATDGRCVRVQAGASCDQSYTLDVTFTNGAGCEGSARKIVSVDDNTPPVITCPSNVTLQCTESIDPARTGSATATDNCGGVIVPTYSDVVTAGGCPQAYTIARTWRAADACSNVSTCVQTITVQDTRAPRFVGTLPSDVTVECNQIPMPPTITATDSCDTNVPVVYGEVPTDGTCPDNYTLTRTWTATDDCGNQVQHVQVITVRDTTAPQFVGPLPSDATVECNMLPMPATLTATDNCDTDVPVNYNQQRTDGNCPDNYTLTRTWTATDDCGNSVQHVQVITVRDTTAPQFVGPLPSDVTVECDNVPGPATLTATDNCDVAVAVTYNEQPAAGSCPDNYTLTRTWAATDDCGNSVQHVQVITVRDTTDPRFVGPLPGDDTVECGNVPSPATLTATDNCDHDVYVDFDEDWHPGSCPNSYTLTRTWTATDDCGNQARHVQTIIVHDSTDPRFVEALPGDETVECGNVPGPATLTATDNCDHDVYVDFDEDIDYGSCPDNYTLTRTWVAEDDCHNQVRHVQTVIVRDTTPPELFCPRDITFECDNVGDPGTASARDNCDSDPGIASSDMIEPGRCAQEYTIVRTYRATDDCGNSSVCVQRITIQDTTPPEITCPPDTSFEYGEQIDPDWPVVADNCDHEVVVTYDDRRIDGVCPQSYTIVRTWRAEDDCGNSASCEQRIYVGDHTAPVITCPGDRTFQCNEQIEFGQATAVDSGDPNPVITFVDVVIPGNCDQAYVVERTWTATDACGNSDSCVQTVRVVDTAAPRITCPADRSFGCDQQIEFGQPTATDNCDRVPVITWADQTIPGGNPQEYVIQRTWTATDDCGNAASCVQRVSVEDNTAPTIEGAPDGRLLCAQPVIFTDPVASDNCDPNPVIRVASDGSVQGPGDCEVSYTRCWEAVDAAGNVSRRVCQTIIRYEDTVPPVLTCAPDKEILPGEPVIFDEPTVSDNCPIPGQEPPALQSSFSMSVAEGETTYTTCWIAYDLCGNASPECCQSITVAAPPEPPPYCTFICWNWTAACLKDQYNREISTPPACLRDDHFYDVFPSGVTIGVTGKPGLYNARWTSPGAVERFKCGYGLPAPLTRNYVDPRNYDLGVLQAELLILKLNREFSCAGYFEAYGYPQGEGCFGEYVVPLEVLKFAGLTVDQFIAIGDQAVAGDKSALLPYGYSYQRLWAAAQYLNWIFGDCNGYGNRDASSKPNLGSTQEEVALGDQPAEAGMPLPEVFSMTAEPNPLRASVTIRLAMPTEGDVSVDLYDIQGRKVISLVRARKGAGYHNVTWNGTDALGATVVPGVYFCRVAIDGKPMAMEKLMKL